MTSSSSRLPGSKIFDTLTAVPLLERILGACFIMSWRLPFLPSLHSPSFYMYILPVTSRILTSFLPINLFIFNTTWVKGIYITLVHSDWVSFVVIKQWFLPHFSPLFRYLGDTWVLLRRDYLLFLFSFMKLSLCQVRNLKTHVISLKGPPSSGEADRMDMYDQSRFPICFAFP